MTPIPNTRAAKHARAGRVIALAAAGGILVVVAVVSDPGRSSATAPTPTAPRWLDESGRWPLVGEMLSRDYLVRVYAADAGTLYTVCSTDGEVLRSGLSGQQVAELFPDLDLSQAADGSYLLMQVETDG